MPVPLALGQFDRLVHYYSLPLDERVVSEIVLGGGRWIGGALTVKWHMIEAWRGLLFSDKDQQRLAERDPLAPATRSNGALSKIASKQLPVGSPVHSIRTLLSELTTLGHNACRRKDAEQNGWPFDIDTTPSTKQHEALRLIDEIRL